MYQLFFFCYKMVMKTLYQSSDNSNVFVNYKKGALDLPQYS